MDINSKNRGYLHASVITLIVAILFAVITVSIYIPINDNKKAGNDFSSYLKTDWFAYNLAGYANHILSIHSRGHGISKYNEVKSIKYFFSKQGEDAETITNIAGVDLVKAKENSLHHITLWFDEDGRIRQRGTFEVEGRSFEREIKLYEQLEFYDYELTFVIPKDFDSHKDIFTLEAKEHYFFYYQVFTMIPLAAISLLLVVLVALAVPYSYQNKVAIHRVYNKMFLELKGLVILIILAIFAIALFMVRDAVLLNQIDLHAVLDILYSPYDNFYLIAVPIVFIAQFMLYMTIVYLKYIYNTGFYKGFVLNSFLIKILVTLISKLKMFVKELLSLNLKDNYQYTILKIVLVNLIVLLIISVTVFAGMVIAVIYSVYLFNYLIKFFAKMEEIHKASLEISKGNFDITLEEKEMGILTPISQSLNEIKDGFELAIAEELKSQRLKNELITNVSHDLKTPLTSIITYVDLLKKEEFGEKQREYLSVIDKKSKRLKVLIEDLFEASKASSGNIDLQMEEVDVIALFRQTMGELKDKLEESSLQFKTNIPDHKIICSLDGRRTYRIFENIMSNILKYSLANSRVYIDVEEKEETITFIFKNISSYEMNFDASEMTERFSRGDKSRNTEGSGLGLAITKDLVEMQKGRIEISIDGDLFKLALTFTKLKDIQGEKRVN